MKLKQLLTLSICIAGLVAISSADPTTAPSATEPSISPQTAKLLDQIRQAYASLKYLDISGKIVGHLDIDGEHRDFTTLFSGRYAPGKFHQETQNDAIFGCSGDKLYVYFPDHNRYLLDDAPQNLNLETLPPDLAELLLNQNLSLALAFSPDAAKELSSGVTSIDVGPSIHVGDETLDVIRMDRDLADDILAFDPQTHLLRRQILDLTRREKARGAQVVKAASVTTDFTNTVSDTADADKFAWTPPAGSQPLPQMPAEGKRVPAFSFPDLNGQTVSTSDFAGSIVLLDLWATWCGPCIASLPDRDAMYQQLKSQGLKVYAINEGDEKAVVQKFMADHKLTLPVLLDINSTQTGLYGGGAIPTMILINRNGTIRKIFVGVSENQEAELHKAVQDALDGK